MTAPRSASPEATRPATPPLAARYVAASLYIAAAHSTIVYVHYTLERFQAEEATHQFGRRTHLFLHAANLALLLGAFQFVLVFVVHPWVSVHGHTRPFSVYIVTRFFGTLSLYVEKATPTLVSHNLPPSLSRAQPRSHALADRPPPVQSAAGRSPRFPPPHSSTSFSSPSPPSRCRCSGRSCTISTTSTRHNHLPSRPTLSAVLTSCGEHWAARTAEDLPIRHASRLTPRTGPSPPSRIQHCGRQGRTVE